MLVTLLASSPLLAVPSPEGLSGILRLPSAFVSVGTAGYLHKGDAGVSFAYPLSQGIEAGMTRKGGATAFHTKVQVIPGSKDSLMPVVAAGVQDLKKDLGPRNYFWVMSKHSSMLEATLHAGVRRSKGFFSGKPSYFAGAEYTVLGPIHMKGEYDWGTDSGSVGVEFQLNPSLAVFDYYLDSLGNSTMAASNLIGVSFQTSF